MSTFRYLEYFPCLCEDCEDVVQGDLKEHMHKRKYEGFFSDKGEFEKPTIIPLEEREFTCPECNGNNVMPYNNHRIIGMEGDRVVARNFDNVLTNGDYKCPKCNKMTLKFSPSFYRWD